MATCAACASVERHGPRIDALGHGEAGAQGTYGEALTWQGAIRKIS